MRKTGWTITVLIIVVILLSGSSAYTEGLSGWVDVVHTNSKDTTETEGGDLKLKTKRIDQNVYLNFKKSITPMLSYQLNLRTNFSDRDETIDATDIEDAIDIFGETKVKETRYRRTIEPGVEIMFGNPLYDLTAGYTRQEDWDTAHLDNDSRITTEFYYSRLNITPRVFPSLNLEYNRLEEFDHLDDSEIDETNTQYSIGSSYELPSQDIRFKYTLNYTSITNKTPLDEITDKTENDNFNGTYNIGYSGDFWRRKVNYYVNYQGNYSRNKNKLFVTQTGSVLVERTPYREGLYSRCNGFLDGLSEDETFCQLNTEDGLIDNNYTLTGMIADIDLTSTTLPPGESNNIGVEISASNMLVDTIYIYYDNDGRADSITWEVYSSNDNKNWGLISLVSVNPVRDPDLDVWRYEITFPQTSSRYFKVINSDTVNPVAGSNVKVTEIEALGTEFFAGEGTDTTVTNIFDQGLNANATWRALPTLTFTFNYFLDRTDQNPISFERSVGDFFENIVSDSFGGGKDDFRSDIVRNYGASSTWLTHRLLTTTFRFQRSESFDNRDEFDVSLNTYNLSFNSVPLPTLDATLTLIRNDSFDFNDKDSTSHSAIASVGAKLYRDVNMINDVSYTRTKSYETDETTKSTQINGNIDAVLTRELSGTLNYGFQWVSVESSSTDSKDATAILTYRPGKFINISGTLSVFDFDGDKTYTEGVQVDWLPLPAIRLNTNYQHSDRDPGSERTDSLSGYVIWYITQFADLRFTYAYTEQKADTRRKLYNFITELNCRF